MTSTAKPSKHIAKAIGPRQVGGRYLCGYWQHEYTVLAINTAPTETWMSWSITVHNADGSIKTHCTAWDPRKDKVISQPAAGPVVGTIINAGNIVVNGDLHL